MANKAANLILIGFMGTGKSSVGRRVASSLGYRFVDTDKEIVDQEGQEIADIFAERGEEVFRQIETQVLERCCQSDKQIISTGGGIVIREENRKILAAGGLVIWLRAEPESVYDRTKHNTDRPLLATDDPQQTIKDLLESREPLYKQCADLIVSTDDLSLDETIFGVTETAQVWQTDGRL